MSPVIMSSSRVTPPVEGGTPQGTKWEVGVSGSPQNESSEWVAYCDTLDEAIEIADSLKKRYFVSIRSYEEGWRI